MICDSDDLVWIIDGDTLVVGATGDQFGDEINYHLIDLMSTCQKQFGSELINKFVHYLRTYSHGDERPVIPMIEGLALAYVYDAGMLMLKEQPERFQKKYGTIVSNMLQES